MVVRSIENANEIRTDIKTRDLLSKVQRTFMLTYILFMAVIYCPSPQFAFSADMGPVNSATGISKSASC